MGAPDQPDQAAGAPATAPPAAPLYPSFDSAAPAAAPAAPPMAAAGSAATAPPPPVYPAAEPVAAPPALSSATADAAPPPPAPLYPSIQPSDAAAAAPGAGAAAAPAPYAYLPPGAPDAAAGLQAPGTAGAPPAYAYPPPPGPNVAAGPPGAAPAGMANAPPPAGQAVLYPQPVAGLELRPPTVPPQPGMVRRGACCPHCVVRVPSCLRCPRACLNLHLVLRSCTRNHCVQHCHCNRCGTAGGHRIPGDEARRRQGGGRHRGRYRAGCRVLPPLPLLLALRHRRLPRARAAAQELPGESRGEWEWE